MKNRVYKYMLLIIFIVATILTATLSLVFYQVLSGQYIDYIKAKATDFAFIINQEGESEGFYFLEQLNVEERVTLINQEGIVTFDNYTNDEILENHSERPEVISAMEVGEGESKRYSKTMLEETYYYAIKLDSGDILRVSITTDAVINIFAENLHIIILITIVILILSNFLALTVTKKIIDPFSKIDFDFTDEVFYEELIPYINKIKEQKRELTDQISNIKYQNNTILTITNNMKEGVILVDGRNNILTINKSVRKILNIENKDFTGKSLLTILKNREILSALKHLDDTNHHCFKIEKNSKLYRVSISPVYSSKKIKGAVIFFVNITKKEQIEKFRQEFSANVSHELKTPLMSILGYAELIESGMAKEEDKGRFISKIKNEASNMTNLIEDIMLISELDESVSHSNKNAGAFNSENILDIVNHSVDTLDEFAKKEGLKL